MTATPSSPSVPASTALAASSRRLGKLRRLQRISDTDGFMRVAAIDHPENYLALFDEDISTVGFEEVVESKLELVRAMSAACSAVLLDPVWSMGQAVLTQAVPGSVGIISGLEELAYSPSGFGTQTVVREHWTVPVLARLGADAAKLVVFFREELQDVSASQLALVADLVTQCDEAEVPLVVEPLWYPLEGESLDDPATRALRDEAVVSSAHLFAACGADVMKVEFPGRVGSVAEEQAAAERCARLDAGLDVPWVLLSASATFEQFRTQVGIAASAGACGFMAGRAIWGDAVGRVPAEQRAAGARTAVQRLQALHSTLREHGRGWTRPATLTEAVDALPATWHETYGS
ncbi:tagatose 1,6-diphosphate aldolase [Aeromicrobium sp. CTD01-1L150]|uniref:tagatose 1,6-diphosphate aldolase n=1 Tax=Aeromicrobium sp. CTD01-1L150 TaxID=3341830 RepID=UPI0035BEDA64